jgi:pyruvate dehydrogenase E1 component
MGALWRARRQCRRELKAFVDASALGEPPTACLPRRQSRYPRSPVPEGAEQSTQAAFGRILLDLPSRATRSADRIVTTSPDVTVSTNLGAFVNQRGLFRRQELKDVFQLARIPSAQKWAGMARASMSSWASPRTTSS